MWDNGRYEVWDVVREQSGVVNHPEYENAKGAVRKWVKPLDFAVRSARDLHGPIRLVVKDQNGDHWELDIVDVVNATKSYDELKEIAKVKQSELAEQNSEA